ncbi:MAG: hypothetical protein K2H58_04205, partial [Paramuribaculum sp.]|nr:hypothetical protein [Paramuribaculum sp.]
MKFSHIILLLLAIALRPASMSAQAAADSDPYPDYQEDVFMDMDFEENLLTPAVGKDAQKAVRAYM